MIVEDITKLPVDDTFGPYEGKVTAISKAMAMIEFDLQGNVLAANENFLDLFGYGLDEVFGQHHALFCDPAHVQS